MVLTWNSGSASLYFDGSATGSAKSYSTAAMALDSTAAVGQYTGGGEYFDGIIDELRVSSTPRSASWIAASYLTMTDAFLTFGSEESL